MKTLLFLLPILLFTACNVKPQPINYGSEGCAFCKMTIVDRQYASQMVTNHGKTYNFDSVECMMHFATEHPDRKMELYRVNDFNEPGTFLDATEATFLKSPKLKSPMGENLSAYKTVEAAHKAQTEYDGQLYSWKELQKLLKQ